MIINENRPIKTKVHILKTWPEYFESVYKGIKTAELRINDRDFKIDDIMVLKEYDHINDEYSGRKLITKITHITSASKFLKENCVMLSFIILDQNLWEFL